MGKNRQPDVIDGPILEPVLIANNQKIGEFRFLGKPTPATKTEPRRPGVMVAIPAGKEVEVPGEVWARYKDRADIKSLLGRKLILGGLNGIKATDMSNTGEARQMLYAQQKDLEEKQALLEARIAELRALEN